MSTNFYLTIPSAYQDIKPLVLHIGKRSSGWVFSFQSYHPEVVRDLTSWDDWKAFLSAKPSAKITDDYDRPYTLREFKSEIFDTLEPWGPDKLKPRGKTPQDHAAGLYDDRKTVIDKHGFSHSHYEFS